MKKVELLFEDEAYEEMEVCAGTPSVEGFILGLVMHRVRHDPKVQELRRRRREAERDAKRRTKSGAAANTLKSLIELSGADEAHVRAVWQRSMDATATLDDAFELAAHELGMKEPKRH